MVNESPSLWSDVHSRKRRKRRLFVLAAYSVSTLLVFIGIGWAVFHSQIFLVKEIKVVGNKNVSNEDVITLVEASISRSSFINRAMGAMNIIVWPKNLPADDFKLLPELKSLSVGKDYGRRKIEITVEERSPAGVWCFYRLLGGSDVIPERSAPDCFWFDAGGVIFKKAVNMEGSIITVVDDYSQKDIGIGSKILPDQFIDNVFSIFRAVSAAKSIGIKEIRLTDLSLEELEVDTYDGPKIYFSLRFPIPGLSDVIDSLKAKPGFKNLQYVDFRTGNRVYYK